MAEPTNELMLQILIKLQEDMASLRADVGPQRGGKSLRDELTALTDRFDIYNERLGVLGTAMNEGFALHSVARRRTDDFVRAVDSETTDLKARIVALELRVSQLERQD